MKNSNRFDLRRVNRGIRAGKAADDAGAAVLAMPAGLIVLLACVRGNARSLVTDFNRAERIGSRNGGRHACADRGKKLHHQRNREDRQKNPQQPPHLESPPKRTELITA
ncbi:MAG TPA: hypothetical protein VMM15_29820 [Bradyrhizobium sp.]|nr:hypothetical protein [Bradyrhizobium sp.]